MAHVLVIQLSRLGDVIQTTPLLAEWRAHAPDDQLDVLIQEENRSVLDGFPGLRHVHVVPGGAAYRALLEELAADLHANRPPRRAQEMLTRLNLPKYDTVVNVTYDSTSSWVASQLPCRRLVGGFINKRGERMFNGASHIYFTARHGFRDLNWFNLVDIWRSAVPGGAVPPAGSRPCLGVAVALPFALPSGTKVALNPGSGSSDRRWPPSSFARLAARLTDAGLTPVLVGAPSDRDACAEVVDLCSVPLKSFCGRTTVPELGRLLSEVSLLVSVDTGAVHVASAVGTPVVGLYGIAASFRETAPWGDGHVILQTPLGTGLNQLTPDLVFAACAYRLGTLDGEAFGRQVTAQHATAWETAFLPAGADAMGGLGYRALHAHRLMPQEVFSRALRHVFAGEFRQGDGSVSIDYLREWTASAGQVPPASEVEEAVRGLRATVSGAADVFTRMSHDASEGSRLIRSVTPKTSARLSEIGDGLIGTLDALKVEAEQPASACLAPVVHHVDWTFRTMPTLQPVETFRFHQRKYVWAADALTRALALTEKFFGVAG